MSELNITSSQIQREIPVTILHLSGHLHGNTEHELVDRARQALEAALRLSPSLAGAWNTLGPTLYRLGDAEGALAALRQAETRPGPVGSVVPA